MEIKKTNNLDKTQNIPFKNLSKEGNVDKMQEFIDSYINRAEFELSDIGWFREISEHYKNDNPLRYVNTIGLKIEPEDNSSSSKKRTLKAFVSNANDQYYTFCTLKEGSRDEILQFLKSDDFKPILQDYITQCSDNFFMDEHL